MLVLVLLTSTVKETSTTEQSGKNRDTVFKNVDVIEKSYRTVNYELLAVYVGLKLAAVLEAIFLGDRDEPMGSLRILHDSRYDGDGVRFWGGNKPEIETTATNFNKTAFWVDHTKESSKYAIKYRVTLLMR